MSRIAKKLTNKSTYIAASCNTGGDENGGNKLIYSLAVKMNCIAMGPNNFCNISYFQNDRGNALVRNNGLWNIWFPMGHLFFNIGNQQVRFNSFAMPYLDK